MTVAEFVTHAETRAFEVRNPRPNPGTGLHHYYFGQRGVAVPGPQGYMVNFGPAIRNRAHFHHVDQFQVFFGSPGCTYQRHEIGPLMLHYADADTAYGPFGSGDQPLRFITLRRHGSNFIGYLPEDREKLPKRARRHLQVPLEGWLAEPLPSGGAVDASPVFAPKPDGLAAWRIAAGAGGAVVAPDFPGESGGRYYVVVDGEFRMEHRTLPVASVGWVGPGDDVPLLEAGESGGRLLVLQFAPAMV